MTEGLYPERCGEIGTGAILFSRAPIENRLRFMTPLLSSFKGDYAKNLTMRVDKNTGSRSGQASPHKHCEESVGDERVNQAHAHILE